MFNRYKSDKSNLATEQASWLEVPKSIWYFLGKNKVKWVSLNILLFSVSFYDLVPPYILGKIVDFFTSYKAGNSLNTFYYYAFIAGFLTIAVSFIRLTSKNRLNRISIDAKTNARVEGFERLMEFSLAWHQDENSGNKVQRIFNGSQSINQWSRLINQEIFPIVSTFVGVLSVFVFLSPIFLVFLLIYMFLYFFIEYSFNKKLKKLSDEINQLQEKSTGKYIESTGNMLAIKALGAEKHVNLKIKNNEENTRNFQILRANTGTHKWYVFQTLNGISLIVFYFMLANQFLAGIISVGSIFVYFSYFSNLRKMTDNATDVSSDVIQLRSDLLRMMPIFKDNSKCFTGTENFPSQWKSMQISNMQFNYPSGQIGLAGLNLTINRNEKIGIAGASGSGKSTLVKILLGLCKIGEGKIIIGNKDYYTISHEKIMKNIAVVLQETELFNLSILENITMMRNVDSLLLTKAIEIANLQDVINKLPEGLDSVVGEKGYSLSGGERQRIGIARAIYKNSPIMILDEATASLDSKTEKIIMDKLLAEFGENKTFIIIAHRISTLKNTDRVLVFEKGEIVEQGIYKDLIKDKKTHLGHLFALQNKLK